MKKSDVSNGLILWMEKFDVSIDLNKKLIYCHINGYMSCHVNFFLTQINLTQIKSFFFVGGGGGGLLRKFADFIKEG